MRKFLFSIFFLGACYHSFAQFTWGLKAGANASVVRLNDIQIDNYVLPGYNLGLFADKQISRRVGVLAELSYSTQGTSLGEGGRAFHLNYLSIPLLAEFSIHKNWQIVLGPEAGYLLRAYQHTTGAYGGNSDYLPYFHRFECGMAGGVRYRAGRKWGFEARYVYGFTQIQKPPYSQYGGDVIVPAPYNPKNTLLQGDVFFVIR